MELADDAGGGTRRPCRVQERVFRGDEVELRLQPRRERVDNPLDARVAAGGDRGDVGPLDRELAAARLVDTRNLDERDAVGPEVDVPGRRPDAARHGAASPG